jgi:hypothetical protein
VQVGILGNAADFPGNDFGKTMVFASSDSKSAITRRLMIAFDIRCVGYMMAKMVLRELMDPAIFSLVKNFLTQVMKCQLTLCYEDLTFQMSFALLTHSFVFDSL